MTKVQYLAEGVEYWKDEDTLLLLRCPKCHKENYAPNIAKGICTWCGFDAKPLVQEYENNQGNKEDNH